MQRMGHVLASLAQVSIFLYSFQLSLKDKSNVMKKKRDN